MDCGWDSLCFYDGEDDYGSYLGCFCGEMDDLVIASQSSSLFVVFHSDDSERRAGFEAEWTFVDAPSKIMLDIFKDLHNVVQRLPACVCDVPTVNTSKL